MMTVSSLQMELNRLTTAPSTAANIDAHCQLLIAVCERDDSAAAVHLYDQITSAGLPVSTEAMAALAGVERRRRSCSQPLALPSRESAARTLAPLRRIHKICKGVRAKRNNAGAAHHLDAARAWIACERAQGRECDARSSAKARISVAKQLAAELNVDLRTARALVTNLKQRREL